MNIKEMSQHATKCHQQKIPHCPCKVLGSFVTSKPRGGIRILKTAIGGDDTFTYTTTGQDNVTITTIEGGGTNTDWAYLLPGAYVVTELALAGWTIVSASQQIVNVIAGGTTDVIFQNIKDVARTGSIKVIKNTANGNGAFTFNSDGLPPNLNIVTINNIGEGTWLDVVPGDYDILETFPLGWSVDGGVNPKMVTVVAGVESVIVFNNTLLLPPP